MTAFLILLAASGLLLFAIIELAFTRLMRLPDRLEAERESDGDPLAAYLDDPLRFFIRRGSSAAACSFSRWR
jgi:hypothetical protein